MRRTNLATDNDYFSQLNNKVLPLSACTPTSMVMAATIERCLFPYPAFMQPEDYFMILLRSAYGIALRDQLTSWFTREDVAPNEIHVVVSRMFNDLVGRTVTRFVERGTLDAVLAELRGGHPVVASGGFTPSGHTVCVVGFVENDAGAVTQLIVDDPFGNYFTEYRDQHGNNVEFPVELFNRLWHGFMHTFRRDAFA